MTKVVVNPGICGFSVTVIAGKREGKKIHISLDTECKMVKKMAEDIASLEMMASLTGLAINPVYKSAARHVKHAACPVPSAILKAVEVEAGLCIPKDVNISFVSD